MLLVAMPSGISVASVIVGNVQLIQREMVVCIVRFEGNGQQEAKLLLFTLQA